MAAVAVRRPFPADSDMALAALIQACQKPVVAETLLKSRQLQPYFTSEDEVAHLKKRNGTPGKDRARQVKAKKPKASKPQVPAASPVALSVSPRAALFPKPTPAAPTPFKVVKLAAEGKQWAGPSSFISPKPEALPKPSLSLLRKAST